MVELIPIIPKEFVGISTKQSFAEVKFDVRVHPDNSEGIRRDLNKIHHTYELLPASLHAGWKGTDLRYIQEWLGQSSSKTTERYTHVSKRISKNSKIRWMIF